MHTVCGLLFYSLHCPLCTVSIKDLKVEFGAVIGMWIKWARGAGDSTASFSSMSSSITWALTQSIYSPEAVTLCFLRFICASKQLRGPLVWQHLSSFTQWEMQPWCFHILPFSAWSSRQVDEYWAGELLSIQYENSSLSNKRTAWKCALVSSLN